MGENPMPSEPFLKLNIDLKGPLPESGGYRYILVAVDALTRYAMYIPIADKKGETVFRALLNHVFSLFGMPYGMTIISDNGTEFKNELMDEMSQFLGFRKIAVLPWNPTANSVAESAVKRVKTVLDRHTRRYRDWHKILPLAQYMLNSTQQEGIKSDAVTSPFAALFGRDAPQIPELENPVLRREGDGSVYLESLAERLRTLHMHVKEVSDKLREARRIKHNARICQTEQFKEGDVVYLTYHNAVEAARIRKSGHGSHWRHRYQVVAVKEFAIKLEALEGSPPLDSWQPMHKVSKSPPEIVDHSCSLLLDGFGGIYAPGFTRKSPKVESHPLGGSETVGPPPDEDGYYEVETVLSAYKVGKRWMIRIKWEGYTQPTDEPRVEILRNCTPEVRRAIRHACATAILGNGPDHGQEDALEADESDDDVDEAIEEDSLSQNFVVWSDEESSPLSISKLLVCLVQTQLC